MSKTFTDPLERRLATLSIPVPPSLVPNVLAATARRKAWVRPVSIVRAVSIAAAAIVVATAGASYFAPGFGQALADAPLGPVGDLLQYAGLSNVSGRVTHLSDAATSSGYRIDLVAGYADATRTTLLLKVSPADASALLAAPQSLRLTDQFGHSYELRGGYANSDTGDEAIDFAPLTWPASGVGARLTLHVSAVESAVEPHNVTSGDWQLHGTVALDEARDLVAPSKGALGPATVTFSRVVSTPNSLSVRMTIAGISAEELSRTIPASTKARQAFAVQLRTPSGDLLQPYTVQISGTSVEALWLRPERGTYQIVVSYEGIGAVQREISLP